jgi:hypothetical protein
MLAQEIDQFGYQIKTLDGEPVTSIFQLQERLEHKVGDQVSLVVTTPQGGTQAFDLTLGRFRQPTNSHIFTSPTLPG